MSSKKTDRGHADELEELLHRHQDWQHLEVKARGKDLVVASRDDQVAEELARVVALGQDRYGLSIIWHDGRWQRLPIIGSLPQVIEVLRRDFSSLLQSI